MGGYYAEAAGEREGVLATAIREHYRPRFAGDPSFKWPLKSLYADKRYHLRHLYFINEPPTELFRSYACPSCNSGVITT